MGIAKTIYFRQTKCNVSSPYRKSSQARPPSAAGMGCVRLFFGLFFLAGMVAFYAMTVHPILQVIGALRWPETPCTVDSSRVVVHHSNSSRGGATYSVEVVYHYQYDGRDFTSKRYQFASGSSSGKDRRQRVVDQYPPGKQTVCYVNPSNPAEAVIQRGFNVEMGFGCFTLLFAAVGAGGLFFTSRFGSDLIKTRTRKNAVPTISTVAPASMEPALLKPESTPLGKFFLMLGFALFWNGFMSIFFYLTFLSPNAHTVPWPAKAFVGLFCLIGLLIALGVIGSFMALFNPRILLSGRTNAVPLGGVFQFQWNIRGRAQKLRKIRIVLEGREEAVYRSGKSVQSATQVFAEIPVFESMDNETLDQGSGRVTIPVGLMHSFNGQHSKIVWRLRVRGEVSHRPNVEEDYPILVLPHGISH